MLSRLLWHWLVLACGLYVLTLVTPLGITFDRDSDLFWAALVLIVVNAFLKPILILISLPLVLFSLGLFLLVINGIMLKIIPHIVPGFHVPSFTSAFFGALLLSIITGLFTGWEKRRAKVLRVNPRPEQDVIDV
jgi:putative membrane protein